MKTNFNLLKSSLRPHPLLSRFLLLNLLFPLISFGQTVTLTPSVYGSYSTSCRGCMDGYITASTDATVPFTTFYWFNNTSTWHSMLTALDEYYIDYSTYTGFAQPDTIYGSSVPIGTDSLLDSIGAGHYYVIVIDAAGDYLIYADITLTESDGRWTLAGNKGTNPATDFLGSRDSVDLVFKTDSTEAMRITANGKLGIGTSMPSEKLDIVGNARIEGKIKSDSLAGTGYRAVMVDSSGAITLILVPPTPLIPCTNIPDTWYFGATSSDIVSGGNVGIDLCNPQYPLDVAGIIHGCEVKVDVSNGCDFVFDDKYKLTGLPELEKYLKEHKHLPDIAPAKEMEANGINVGEMQAKLLQKIEELTLYIIEQNKRIEQLEAKTKN